MIRFAAFIFLTALLAAARMTGSPQTGDDSAQKMFDAGVGAFRAGDYALAATAFEASGRIRGRNPLVTSSAIMAAKARYRAGRFDAAISLARRLVDDYPGSAFIPDALHVIALAEYRMGEYDLAASSLATILREHPRTVYAERAKELFGHIASSHLPLSELKRIENVEYPSDLHAIASLSLARAYVRSDQDSLATAVLDRLETLSTDSSTLTKIAELRDEVGTGGAIQVAVLLPVGPEGAPHGLGRLGAEMLDGVRFAAERFNASVPGRRRVDIVVRDVGTDTTGVSDEIARIASSARVRAVLGPVFSGPFAAASVTANAHRLPILSPTATGDRIAAIGPYVFQANPDNETRGRVAAIYAVTRLRMSSFLVMASDDPVGRSHARAFAGAVRSLGGTVYASVLFPPDASDLRSEFLAMRRAVMADGALIDRRELGRQGVPEYLHSCGADTLPVLLDTASTLLSVTSLFGARGYVIADSLGIPIAVDDTTAETIDIPMVTADGLYIALGDPGQLDYIAPQLDYFNIHAQVIGNNEWYDAERLRENQGALDGAMFLSDFDDQSDDPLRASFAGEFAAGSGRPPTKFTLYGYDAMRLLLEQIGAGARSRTDLAARLSTVDEYSGVHSTISLNDGRINHHLFVMQLRGGEVRRIDTASALGTAGR